MTLIGKPQYWKKNVSDCQIVFTTDLTGTDMGRNPVLISERPAFQKKINQNYT
jgi:hypothetical protein